MVTTTSPETSVAPGRTYAPRRRAGSVIWEWMTTVDHKKIGCMYIALGTIYFIVGGVEALLIRVQLATPNERVLSPSQYDQIFTMHATTMIFLFFIPVMAGFANYFFPLMIGARDMAFPRLNAFGFWMLLFGGLFLNSSFLFGGAPNAGWFAYAPLTEVAYSPGRNMDFWAAGLTLLGISSIAGAINVIVTTLKMRCPGMRFNNLPLFVWSTLVQNFLLLFALPSLTTAALLLLFDRHLGTSFFEAENGGDPLLYQHLFWAFGHPEVYILILPVFGMVSEIYPVFSRKPIFGYIFVAWSTVAIGFLSFTVWVHHMFAVGLPDVALAFFAASSSLIAIPTAVKIFNWTATLWGGSIVMKTPLHLRRRLPDDVPDRRPLGRLAGGCAVRLAGDGHLLHRRAHPLRLFCRHGDGHLRCDLLLVPEDDREDDGRAAGDGPLLARLHWPQPDLLPDAHARPPRYAAPPVDLPRGHGLDGLQFCRVGRRLHHRGGGGGLHSEPDCLLSQRRAGGRGPVGCLDTGMGHRLAATGIQLHQDASGAFAPAAVGSETSRQ